MAWNWKHPFSQSDNLYWKDIQKKSEKCRQNYSINNCDTIVILSPTCLRCSSCSTHASPLRAFLGQQSASPTMLPGLATWPRWKFWSIETFEWPCVWYSTKLGLSGDGILSQLNDTSSSIRYLKLTCSIKQSMSSFWHCKSKCISCVFEFTAKNHNHEGKNTYSPDSGTPAGQLLSPGTLEE